MVVSWRHVGGFMVSEYTGDSCSTSSQVREPSEQRSGWSALVLLERATYRCRAVPLPPLGPVWIGISRSSDIQYQACPRGTDKLRVPLRESFVHTPHRGEVEVEELGQIAK